MRIALFFDGNNFYRSMHSYLNGLELNYDSLAKWICHRIGGEKAEFVGAYYYTGFFEQSPLDRFLKGLEVRTGFFVRRSPLAERTFHCPNCEEEYTQRVEKRVDTRLVAEMIQMAAMNLYDRAVVLSGDSDLVPALTATATFGKPVYIAGWGNCSISHALRIHSFGQIDLMEGIKHFVTGRKRMTDDVIGKKSVLSKETGLEHLLMQLQEAFSYFNGRNGHVTRWYFENKWKPNGPCPPPGIGRQELLDKLIQAGRVEVFETMINGRVVLALRPKSH